MLVEPGGRAIRSKIKQSDAPPELFVLVEPGGRAIRSKIKQSDAQPELFTLVEPGGRSGRSRIKRYALQVRSAPVLYKNDRMVYDSCKVTLECR